MYYSQLAKTNIFVKKNLFYVYKQVWMTFKDVKHKCVSMCILFIYN